MTDMDSTDPKILAQRLAEARKACGKTQEDVAVQLGVSRPTFIAMEKGSRPVKADELVKMASLYGRSLHDFVRVGGPPIAIEPHLRALADPNLAESADLSDAIGQLARFAEDYRELERLLAAPLSMNYPPQVHLPARGNIADFAERAAVQERQRLGLASQPILNLRRTFEMDVGVRVFYGALPSPIAGMYASIQDFGYCILVNRKHPPERQRMTLAHEYGHFLCDRHKPGIDYLQEDRRRSLNERFAEAFALSFLMPRAGVSNQFYNIVNATEDFQVADLCRLSSYFFVSVQAMALRLEDLGHIPRGTWQDLHERGFSPALARQDLEIEPQSAEPSEPYPERYKYLAVSAFRRDLISEGQLARFLRCDRVTARGVVADTQSSWDTDPRGNSRILQLPFEQSLLGTHS